MPRPLYPGVDREQQQFGFIGDPETARSPDPVRASREHQ